MKIIVSSDYRLAEQFQQWHDQKPVQQIQPTPENVVLAKKFLMQKWVSRSKEMRNDMPVDLTNACRFASMFAYKVFGGKMRGNWYHQFVQLGKDIIDLTDSAGVGPHQSEGLQKGSVPAYVGPHHHDKKFWGNSDHIAKMGSCVPRVEQWVKEFMEMYASRIQK